MASASFISEWVRVAARRLPTVGLLPGTVSGAVGDERPCFDNPVLEFGLLLRTVVEVGNDPVAKFRLLGGIKSGKDSGGGPGDATLPGGVDDEPPLVGDKGR